MSQEYGQQQAAAHARKAQKQDISSKPIKPLGVTPIIVMGWPLKRFQDHKIERALEAFKFLLAWSLFHWIFQREIITREA